MWTGSRPASASADILELPHPPTTTVPTQLRPRFIVRYGMSHRRADAARAVTSQCRVVSRTTKITGQGGSALKFISRPTVNANVPMPVGHAPHPEPEVH